jgi:hypothetical protein
MNRWNKQQDTGWARTNKKGTCGREPAWRFSLTQERGYDRHIREVLQEDSHSSMYKVYDYMIVPGKNCQELSAVYCPCLIMLPMIIRAYTVLPDFSVLIHMQVKNKP